MIDKVTEILSQLKHNEDHQYNKFISKIGSNNSENLINELLNLSPDEIGGRTALAGFYFQFLVAMEYIIEMLDGKWDFVAVELHDDIVVGKCNKIRFIQVKSSKNTHMKVSETGLVKRDTKTIGELIIPINNSWIDKLISKAKHFPPSEYTTEFELVTSYIILKNERGFSIDHYSSNPNFNLELADNDGLLSFMSKTVHNKDGGEVDFNSDLGEPIKNVLSRFRIEKKADLPCLQRYVHHLLVEFSTRIQEGFLMTEEQFFSLIGMLMEKCARIGDNQILVINKEEVDQILFKIRDDLIHKADEIVRRHGSISVIEKVFDSLCSQLQAVNIYPDIEIEIFNYKNRMIDWVNDGGGSLRQLINRYVDGRENSRIFKTIDEVDQNNKLFDLFSVNLLLILIYEDMIEISKKYSSLLVKEISKKHLSFLSLARTDTLESGIEKVKEIILNSADIIQQLRLINEPPKIILQGDFRGRNENVQKHEIFGLTPHVEELNNYHSQGIDKVNIVLDIIPGGKMKEQFENLYFHDDITMMREELKKY